MRHFTYNHSRRKLAATNEDFSRPAFRDHLRSIFMGNIATYGDCSGEPDAVGENLTKASIRQTIGNLAVTLVDHTEDVDAVLLLTDEERELLDTSAPLMPRRRKKLSNRLDNVIGHARTTRYEAALEQAWWLVLNDAQSYQSNPFESTPSEQYTVGEGQIDPINIYNFSETLRRQQLIDILSAFAIMSALTEGQMRNVVPNITIHDQMNESYFADSQEWLRPAGLAWHHQPFIDLRRSAFDGPYGLMGQSWLQRLVVHELTHHIDRSTGEAPQFEKYFSYVDRDRDGVAEKITPVSPLTSKYHPHVIQSSKPIRSYGYTNAREDMSVTAEEVAFGEGIDPIRRDAFSEIVTSFTQQQYARFGDVAPWPNDLHVVRRTGSEIMLPMANMPALSDPIQVGKAHRGSLLSRIRMGL